MPRLRRRRVPQVVASVRITNGSSNQFGGVDVIEAGQIDGVEITAEKIEMPAPERAHAAMLAEQVVHAVAAELVIRERVFARQQPECIRLDDHAPLPRLGADRAIALGAAGAEIQVCFAAHLAAMTAGLVGLRAHDVVFLTLSTSRVAARTCASSAERPAAFPGVRHGALRQSTTTWRRGYCRQASPRHRENSEYRHRHRSTVWAP